jgi:catechol 2,3-dioxygenase-like lactoylglutathione lyase family enzyme
LLNEDEMNFNQLTLPATDLERSARFYRSLGLRLVVDSIPRYARFELPIGTSTLSLHRADSVRPLEGMTLYFECLDLDETVRRLAGEGVVFEGEPVDQPWGWREAPALDPDGHRVCLYRAGDVRRFPAWRVKSEGAY